MSQHDDFDAPDALLTPSEVAALFRVNPKTVTRWARSGKLTAIRTLGGHRRFKASEIRRCLEETGCGHFLASFGGADPDAAMRLFAERVLPAFR